MPIVMSHKATLLTALILSFGGLVLQVQIPYLLNEAVTNSLGTSHGPAVPLHVDRVLVLAISPGSPGTYRGST